jgi:transcriptional regulator with XRE-family HTH domain
MTQDKVDGDWFRQQLARVGKSQNALGAHLGIAGSQSSRLFNGTRKMKFEEVPKIARFLGVTVEDVLKHAGLPVNDKTAKPMMATQFVGPDGKLIHTEPVELSADLINRAREAVPYDRQSQVNAALIRAPKGALAIWDDALVLYEDFGTAPPAMGVLSIAKLRDGVQIMGHVESVKKTGEARIRTADGEVQTVQIEGASKVLAVIP